MTKLEAIEYLYKKPIVTGNSKEDITEREFQAICLECIQHCIDEDDDPCSDCAEYEWEGTSACRACLYSGKIPE